MSEYVIYVCPECGNSEFSQTRTVTAEVTLNVLGNSGFTDISDLSQTITDSDNTWDSDLTCTDCLASYPPDADELVTEDEYNREDEDV